MEPVRLEGGAQWGFGGIQRHSSTVDHGKGAVKEANLFSIGIVDYGENARQEVRMGADSAHHGFRGEQNCLGNHDLLDSVPKRA